MSNKLANMNIEDIVNAFSQQNAIGLLGCGLRGIEKEGLRYNKNHQLATTFHPQALGSALTHDEITTDYAESLLELVTPAYRQSCKTLERLNYLHRVIANVIPDEYMLNASMPAFIADTEAVEIGRYGQSNSGKLRRLYRKGLALRYGKAMQLIAGVHFNYSICEQLFKIYADIKQVDFNREFVDASYMNLVRNIRINSWLISYLFGHSPAVDASFFGDKPHKLQQLGQTLFLPFATSLRLSDIGYQNKTTHLVSSNNLEVYINGLKKAVQTPSELYKSYGLFDEFGGLQQMSCNILQIENEYYSVARPKQIVNRGEPTVCALNERGIAYVELRTLDINCFESAGISQTQLDFLELYMLYNLFVPAEQLDVIGESEARDNLANVAARGRDPQLVLHHHNQDTSVKKWGNEIISKMRAIADAMDANVATNVAAFDGSNSESSVNNYSNCLECADKAQQSTLRRYNNVLDEMLVRINDEKQTPSADILSKITADYSYHELMTDLSLKHNANFKKQGLTEAELESVEMAADTSLQKEQQLVKQSEDISFEDYLDCYMSRLQ